MKTITYALSATSLMALAAPCVAQTNENAPDAANPPSQADSVPEPVASLGDIIVTAQKRSENVNKVGVSITAVQGDALQQRGVVDTADLIKITPGFNFVQSAYGVPVLTLRGVGFYDTAIGAASAVSVYVDEVPLPLSIMALGATLDLNRVEILKGPQGTLYGQNATGGAINYISARPTDSFHSGADLTYGRFNRVELKGFVSGPITDTLTARIAARFDRNDDWQRSYTRDATNGEGNIFSGRAIVDWKPSDRLRFSFMVHGWRDRSESQAPQLAAITGAASPAVLRTYPLPPRDNRAADFDPDLSFKRNSWFAQVSGRADYDLSDTVTITSITAYSKLKRLSAVDADGTAIQAYALINPGRSRDFSQELRLSGDSGQLHYVVGLNYAWESVFDQSDPLARTSSFPFQRASAHSDQHINTYAAFASLDYKLTDTLTLQGGVRYTDQHRRFIGCTYDSGAGDFSAVVSRIATARAGHPITIAPGACLTLNANFEPAQVRSQLNEDNISWRGGVNWQVNPTTLLYANISKGYKNGAFPTAGATFALQLTPATQESLTAYEAGFKLGLFDRKLQLNGAVFYYDYRDKQFRGRIVDPVIGPQSALINVPKSRVAGGEIQATLRPISGLTINTGVTYVGTRILGDFVNFDALAQQVRLSGEAFPLTPDWQVTSDIDYQFSVSDSMNGFVGGGATYQAATNGGLGELPQFAIDSYTLIDVRAGVALKDDRWRLTAYVKNLTDKFYATLVSQPGPDAAIRFTGQPRTYGLTLSYRY
ncbi:Outer membrane receptor proteins, mostly Fe transport [Sphingobium sp. AP50]|uniref:TonB-dependent receptor n=1 Tax=Sphingobium sp. AP50 TaxID=1884369 RepID=UPI0008B63001|nr:TonB-dependent receptor [Sphingobium sp. AP50]SEJ47990.1 Outer membrane receptor proteins, mostly Fe transport [Sphingobium sp. AP50]